MRCSVASRTPVREKPKLAGLLLAAGESKRLGQPKQLVKVRGESLVLRTARLLLTQTPNVHVVVGANTPEIAQSIEKLPVRITRNSQWRDGLGSSIACGMNQITGNFDGVLIMLCDQWRVEHQDLNDLVKAWYENPSVPSVATWKESFGSPAIFPKAMFEDLMQLNGERGAKSLLEAASPIRQVGLPNAGFDLDTIDDLHRMSEID
jgi:molybdenum cofactor cytidylyltransferase